MPELPEVQTTVNGLNKKVLNRAFVDVWSDWKKIVKQPKDFEQFKKEIKNKKILKVYRRAKNIIIDLENNNSLLIHQKMTGHLLIGKWEQRNNVFKPIDKNSPLNDPYNRFLHIIFYLNNGEMLALSDARKFAKIELWKTKELKKELEKFGPEPLERSFTFGRFKEIFINKKGKVKEIITRPEIIAGIGNIYASEALWMAKIHPEKNVKDLNNKELKNLYDAIIKVLEKSLKLGGDSFSDYRKIDGTKGNFHVERKVYSRKGQKCYRCGNIIKQVKVAQRSTFYCSSCQQL